uniref:Uncharacterized protein n=1 Tax=viral metagenome TaxID=1070528 RepID=A0A6C0AD77_9ZZZZ
MSLYKIKLWKEIVKNHNKSKESKETKSINTDFTENNSNEYKKQINICIVMKDRIKELKEKMEQPILTDIKEYMQQNKQNKYDEIHKKEIMYDLEYKNNIKFDFNYLQYL